MEQVVNKFDKLWFQTISREGDDGNSEITLFIADPERHGVLSIIVTENDRKTPSQGDLNIYDYDFKTKITTHLKHNEFFSKYTNGNKNVGETVLFLIKTRLNNAEREHLCNEGFGELTIDGDKRYVILRSKSQNIFTIIGLNINLQYAESIISSKLEEYQSIIVTDTPEKFSIQRDSKSYPEFTIRFIEKQTEEEGRAICKEFLESLKSHRQKLAYPKSIKYGMSLYSEYSKYLDEYNKQAIEFKKKLLNYTFNGTKIKKYEYRTEDDKVQESELNRESANLELLYNQNTHTNKSKGIRYIKMIQEMKQAIRDMKNWGPNTSYKGNTCHLDVAYSDISEMGLTGQIYSFKKHQDDINKLKDFIEQGTKSTGRFYVTYTDGRGNSTVEETRLFYNNGVAEFRKGSSKHGHYIDSNWIEIDYVVKEKNNGK